MKIQTPPANPQEKTPGNTPGFPSIAEQEAYWKQKEVQQGINEKMLDTLDSIRNTMQHILDAVSGLKDICEHQQKEIDKLKQKESVYRKLRPEEIPDEKHDTLIAEEDGAHWYRKEK